MSPEQARGKPVDKRTDIWAFGCVLYEMLSGRRAFTGETVADVLAAILSTEPDWSRLPAATPPRLRELLARCLRERPEQAPARHRRRAHGDRAGRGEPATVRRSPRPFAPLLGDGSLQAPSRWRRRRCSLPCG